MGCRRFAGAVNRAPAEPDFIQQMTRDHGQYSGRKQRAGRRLPRSASPAPAAGCHRQTDRRAPDWCGWWHRRICRRSGLLVIQFEIQIGVELVFFVGRVGGNRLQDGAGRITRCATGAGGDAGDRRNHILPVGKLSLQSRKGHGIDISTQAIAHRKGSQRCGDRAAIPERPAGTRWRASWSARCHWFRECPDRRQKTRRDPSSPDRPACRQTGCGL